MRASRAFCPGHVTCLFVPRRHDDPLRTGSVGAGVCVDKGARSLVEAVPGDGRVTVNVNGRRSPAPVTTMAVGRLIQGRRLDVEVDTVLELPPGCGFGMSAAGSLSAAWALADALGLDERDALEAAHVAEVANGTGLGDVAGLSAGGVEMRLREGAPPYGRAVRLDGGLDMVAAVTGPPMSTSAVLSGPGGSIERAGTECWSALLGNRTVQEVLAQGRRFTDLSGLAPPGARGALARLEGTGPATMVMLGDAVLGAGDLEEQSRRLGPSSFRLRSDPQGPRIIA